MIQPRLKTVNDLRSKMYFGEAIGRGRPWLTWLKGIPGPVEAAADRLTTAGSVTRSSPPLLLWPLPTTLGLLNHRRNLSQHLRNQIFDKVRIYLAGPKIRVAHHEVQKRQSRSDTLN